MKFPRTLVKTLTNLVEAPPAPEVTELGDGVVVLEGSEGAVLIVPLGTDVDQVSLTKNFGDCTLVQVSATFYRLEQDGRHHP